MKIQNLQNHGQDSPFATALAIALAAGPGPLGTSLPRGAAPAWGALVIL